MSNKPVARLLSIHRTTQTQNNRIHRHPCLEGDSNPRTLGTTALARTSSNSKRHTHPPVREQVTQGLQPQVFSWKIKITGRDSQGACRHDELTASKPPVTK
jgi:hypothetical protein